VILLLLNFVINSFSSNSLIIMRPVGWGGGGVRHGNGLSGVTSSFHTLSAVGCSKLLVFIQYIISIYCFMAVQYTPSGV